MIQPCPQKIDCDCNLLLSNYTSEAADRRVFLGRHYGFNTPAQIVYPPNIPPGIPPETGCVTFSNSLLSVQDANWCALFSLTECEVEENLVNPCWTCRGSGGTGWGYASVSSPNGDPCCDPDLPENCCCSSDPQDPNDGDGNGDGNGDGPVTPPRLYCNDPQSCTAECPDGTEYTASMAACQFAAVTKGLANRIAHSAACQKAEQDKICTDDQWGGGNPCKVFCFGEDSELQLNATAASGTDVTWSIESGELPNGLSLSEDGLISGTPTGDPGESSVTLKLSDGVGNTMTREICIRIMAFDTDLLADGECNAAYNDAVVSQGGYPPITYSMIGGDLPAGLTVNSDGTITGTPTQSGYFAPVIQATDHLDNQCAQEFQLFVDGVGNEDQAGTAPCQGFGWNEPWDVPAGSVCSPPGYPPGAPLGPIPQDIANILAFNQGMNDAADALAAGGCTCYISDIHQDMSAAGPNPNLSRLTLNCPIICNFDLTHGYGGPIWVGYGPSPIGPGTLTFCQLFNLFVGQPCVAPFLIGGRTYHLRSAGVSLAWFGT